ncbi:uncharacterized protein LOC127280435 isoform X2 [Leptopilina boulardi]|nr:uncharacterized protein LOC127280435 isoform X2 [Leptopilina boulardi]XP_051159359.1 uncharacterized protein LOC127280435 isoform X2 [Leptopilina boulardi]
MNSSTPEKNVKITNSETKKKKDWVQFEDESDNKVNSSETQDTLTQESSESVTLKKDMENENGVCVLDNEKCDVNMAEKNNSGDYSGAVIPTESVQINLDRSGLNHSIGMEDSNMSFSAKTNSLKTIDLRNPSNNGRTISNNTTSTSTGFARQGFVNGDTIVTLLPVNTRWPWVTPARFKPELVPEELMAQGLTLTVEDYVHIMELLVNDVRFNMYNICYKRVLVLWIFIGFVILLGLLFSGVTGLTLFGLGVMWLVLNAAAIFLCMFIKIKLNQNLEKCMAQVNKHLLRHKILLGLDDRGKISCHKVNLCFLYFDSNECVNKLQDFIEAEERDGRAIGEDESSKARRAKDMQQRMDIDDTDIVIQGSTITRLSRKQGKSERVFCRYTQRWAKDYLRRRLDWTVDEEGGNPSSPRHLSSAICPCQYIEEWLRNKSRIQGRDFCPTWSTFLRDRGI